MMLNVQKPLVVSDDRQDAVSSVELGISDIFSGDKHYEFESEGKIALSPEEPYREVYYHSDEHGDNELVFFALELKGRCVHLLPGNSNISTAVVNGVKVDLKAGFTTD